MRLNGNGLAIAFVTRGLHICPIDSNQTWTAPFAYFTEGVDVGT